MSVSPYINKPYLPPSFQNQQTLTSTLTQNLATLNILSETSQSHNSYVSARFALIHLITSGKVMNISIFSENKAAIAPKWKCLQKPVTNSYQNQNEKTIMVTTWHSALKHLSKILQEKYHQHIEKDIYLQKVFPEKPIIAFRKMKSIRDYIVTTDINKVKETERNLK